LLTPGRRPRYYVMRVLHADDEGTPLLVSVVGFSYPSWMEAWLVAKAFREEHPHDEAIYIAGEMGVTAAGAPGLPVIRDQIP
jgi:hypothetical protein